MGFNDFEEIRLLREFEKLNYHPEIVEEFYEDDGTPYEYQNPGWVMFSPREAYYILDALQK